MTSDSGRGPGLRRRRFLVLAAALAGGAIVGGGAAARWCRRRFRPWSFGVRRLGELGAAYRHARRPLAAAVRAYFAYLQVEADAPERFARDYESAVARYGGSEGMDQILARFLASTDFFQNGADEARPVRYVALYHPYATPCYTPFTAVD